MSVHAISGGKTVTPLENGGVEIIEAESVKGNTLLCLKRLSLDLRFLLTRLANSFEISNIVF